MFQNKERKNFFLILFVFIVIIGGTVAFLIYTEYAQYRSYRDFHEQQLLQVKKDDIQNELYQRVSEISYNRELFSERAIEEIEREINHLRELVSTEALMEETPQSMLAVGLEIINTHALENPQLLYFVLSREGDTIRSGIDGVSNNQNVLGLQDRNGKYYMRDMMQAALANGSALETYYWPKEAGGDPKEKTSYLVYVQSLDIFIGAGVYTEDVEATVKGHIFRSFQYLYEGEREYLFAVTYDGIAKVFANQNLLERSVVEVLDSDGVPIHDIFMKVVVEEGEGFTTYKYYEPNSTQKSDKISYIIGIPEWEVYLGLGFYTEDFKDDLAVFFRAQRESMQERILLYTGFFMLYIIGAIFLLRKLIKDNQKIIREEEAFYEKFAALTTEAIVITDLDDQITFMNVRAQSMLKTSLESQVFFKSFYQMMENYVLLTAMDGKEYYVELHSDELLFQGRTYRIYFIHDISAQYEQEKVLESISTTDFLTSAPNRRRLTQFFEEEVKGGRLSSEHLCLAMIDLDHFKDVNDVFGHDVGDEVLKTLVKVFNQNTREADCIYRYGGEEFVAIFDGAPIKKGVELLNRINEKLANYPWVQSNLKITFSAGIVPINQGENLRSLSYYLKAADTLLYRAKANGRNRVES